MAHCIIRMNVIFTVIIRHWSSCHNLVDVHFYWNKWNHVSRNTQGFTPSCFPYVLKIHLITCADPESFVRGGPTMITFLGFFSLMRGVTIQIPLLAGHQRPTSVTPFKLRFAGGPMMAQHGMLAW